MEDSRSESSRSLSTNDSSSLKSFAHEVIWPCTVEEVDVDWSHVLPSKLRQIEICEIEPIEQSSQGLIDIARNVKFPPEILSLWKGFWNPSKDLFQSEDQVKINLQTIIDYCEKGLSTELCKQQLRFIHKELQLKTQANEVVSIIVMLSAHGAQCDVQKEVGIRMAYALVTESIKNLFQQSLETHLLRFLLKQRLLLIEKIFQTKKAVANSEESTETVHRLIPFQNEISTRVGLLLIPDPESQTTTPTKEDLKAFEQLYTCSFILSCVTDAFNQVPSKIPHEALIEFLKQNRLPTFEGSTLEFLEKCFDVDSGLVLQQTLIYTLIKLHILKRKEDSCHDSKAASPSQSNVPFGPSDGNPKVKSAKKGDHEDEILIDFISPPRSQKRRSSRCRCCIL